MHVYVHTCVCTCVCVHMYVCVCARGGAKVNKIVVFYECRVGRKERAP